MGCRGCHGLKCLSNMAEACASAPGPGRSGRRGHRGRPLFYLRKDGKGWSPSQKGCTKPTAIDVGARKSKPSLLTHSYSKTLRAWRSIVPIDHVYTHTHTHAHTRTHTHTHTHTHPPVQDISRPRHTHTQGRFSKHWEKNRESANDTSPRRSENEWAKAIECWGLEVRSETAEGYIMLHLLTVSKHKHRHKHTHTQSHNSIYI